jgi:DNA-binding CsgD family transcriptional regulator
MNTIPGRRLQILIDTAEAAGVDTRPIVAALFASQPLDPAGRYPWDLYAELGDYLAGLFPSDEDVVEAFAAWSSHLPGLAATVSHITDPMVLSRLVADGLADPDVPALETFRHDLTRDRYTWGYTIAPHLRGARGGALVSAGLLRGQPPLIGLPRAHVEIVHAESHRFLAHVTLPPPRAQQALVPDISPDAARHASGFLHTLANEREDQRKVAEAMPALCQELGTALATAPSAEAAGRLLVDVLAQVLGARHVLLWVDTGRASKLLAAHGTREGGSRTLRLVVGPRDVGSLELPDDLDVRALEPSLPLLARTLAAHLDAPARWRLTEAERRVAELLARGCTNATIAERLGIAVDTAAEHVSRVLKKSGAKRRADLVALWRAEPHEPHEVPAR